MPPTPRNPQRSEARRAALADVAASVRSARVVDRYDQCRRCRGAKSFEFPTCASCRGRPSRPELLHFSCSVPKPSPFYASFVRYKVLAGKAALPHRLGLAAALSGGYEVHAESIRSALAGYPTIVSPIPSTKGVSYQAQPLRHVIELVGDLREELSQSLEHTSAPRAPHTFQPDLFRPVRRLAGERVLLIEDLWVGGGTAESAVHIVANSGAAVAVLSIGREQRPDFGSCTELLDTLGPPEWW